MPSVKQNQNHKKSRKVTIQTLDSSEVTDEAKKANEEVSDDTIRRRPYHNVEEPVKSESIQSESIQSEPVKEENEQGSKKSIFSQLNLVLEIAKQAQNKIPKVSDVAAMASYGSYVGVNLVKSKFPKSTALVEKVATDWVNDGDFKELPIDTPLVQHYVAQGLKQAKTVEKKIEERLDQTGVLTVAKHQLQRLKKILK